MKLTVIGAGYVGITASACLAEMGHTVRCAEKDAARISGLRSGILPFYEPGLDVLVRGGLEAGRLEFVADPGDAIPQSALVFIAVGTPPSPDGDPDLTAVDEVLDVLALHLQPDQVVVFKSTVPVGTTDRAAALLRERLGRTSPVACNPEFLREGSAVGDFLHPDRVIIGSRSEYAAEQLSSLYRPLGAPILVTDPPTAEMTKYAANAFLATKVSFINEIATLCQHVDADVATVAAAMGLDHRIAPHFLNAGIGFGGSCLPKDVSALIALAGHHGVSPDLLQAVMHVNASRRRDFVDQVDTALGGIAGKTVGILGLAFKAGTSDVRESPAIDIAARLIAHGATVQAFDPAAQQEAAQLLPAARLCPDAYAAADGADVLLMLAEWPEFRALDWTEMRRRVRRALVIDGRGMQLKTPLSTAGFAYVEPGRSVPAAAAEAVLGSSAR